MAATYYDISEEEMNTFLTEKGFKQVALPNTREIVYGKRVDKDGFQLTLRVYTGIIKGHGSRSVGKDAIRVNLFNRTSSGNVNKVGGSKRVHRVQGWANNLQKRLDDWLNYSFTVCECGNLMIPRKSKTGKFLGCSNYPNCKRTMPLRNKG